MIWVLWVEIGPEVVGFGPLTLAQCVYLIEGFLPHIIAVCLPWQG
jgi:hypothetical protein